MTKKINATRRKRIRNKRNKRKSNKIKRKKSYRIKRVNKYTKNKYKKKQEGGTNLIRGYKYTNPNKMPDENMMFITGDQNARPSAQHLRDFNDMINRNYQDSWGKVKVYMLFSFLGAGIIFHPIIVISEEGAEGINLSNRAWQLVEEENGLYLITQDTVSELQEFSEKYNIKAMVYIGYFVKLSSVREPHETEFINYLKGNDDTDLDPVVNGEYYSLVDNNCQTYCQNALAKLKQMEGMVPTRFVSAPYRWGFLSGDTKMVDLDLTQLHAPVRRAVVSPFMASVNSTSSSLGSGPAITEESTWEKVRHGGRAYYFNTATKAFTTKTPEEGFYIISDETDKEDFENEYETAENMDRGDLQPTTSEELK
jgi:hypothetical protein